MLMLIVPYFFIVGTFQLIGGLIAGADLMDPEAVLTSGQKLSLQISSLLGTFLLLWVFMKKVDKESFVNLGFHTKNRGREFLFGTWLGAVIMGGGLLLLLGIEEVGIAGINFDPTEFLIAVVLFIIVAVVEEVLLRGYILKNLCSLSTSRWPCLYPRSYFP